MTALTAKDRESVHLLHPFPLELVRLLRSGAKGVAAKVDGWLARHSSYASIDEWIDASGNLEERRRLGAQIVEILKDGSTALLDE